MTCQHTDSIVDKSSSIHNTCRHGMTFRLKWHVIEINIQIPLPTRALEIYIGLDISFILWFMFYSCFIWAMFYDTCFLWIKWDFFIYTIQNVQQDMYFTVAICILIKHCVSLYFIDKHVIHLNSSGTGDKIFWLWGSIPCLLMHWLLKSLEHQQAWYWLCRTDNM